MPDGSASLTLSVVDSLSAVTAAEWDACAGDENPTVGHAFLSAMEDSGCTTAESGWQPQHLTLRAADGRLVGAVPLYLKSHSYGEYVFDWGWAEAFERAGGRYYPKLQCSVPFTPVGGPRLLAHPEADAAAVKETLASGLAAVLQHHKASSVHVTFPGRDEWDLLGEAGFLQRIGRQYHWHNEGYGSFDDFLGALASRKRKALRKERAAVAAEGVTFQAVTGSDLHERHWDAFYRFYIDTVDRKWGGAYLNREFFSLLGERMPERVVLILAEQAGRPVAGALNLLGRDRLYGRNWGCAAEIRFLHFETCYYQAIDFAIARGLSVVEAGAQGEHKIQRGYLPVETYSTHLIADPGFRRAVADFLERETRAVRLQIAALAEESPFRQEEG